MKEEEYEILQLKERLKKIIEDFKKKSTKNILH